jgi:hypothetical protein
MQATLLPGAHRVSSAGPDRVAVGGTPFANVASSAGELVQRVGPTRTGLVSVRGHRRTCVRRRDLQHILQPRVDPDSDLIQAWPDDPRRQRRTFGPPPTVGPAADAFTPERFPSKAEPHDDQDIALPCRNA